MVLTSYQPLTYSQLVSPYRYRVTTQISIDKGPYRNLGTAWYR